MLTITSKKCTCYNSAQLTQGEIALLYSALLFYKEHSEASFAATVINNGTPLYKEFFKHVEQSTKELMQKLFGETFVDELDFVRDFNLQWAQKHNSKKQPDPQSCQCEIGIKNYCPIHHTFG